MCFQREEGKEREKRRERRERKEKRAEREEGGKKQAKDIIADNISSQFYILSPPRIKIISAICH
jgi:hypothetical protein